MAVENITLNLIPTGDTPSIHVAQFDVDRPFTVTLKEGEDDFTPTDYDIELQVRKVDNNIVTTVPAQTSGNVVTFNTTEQMTACSGTNIAELQLTKDSQTFATLHFYLVVQRDVLAGGVTSESDIYNLTEQIAEIVPEVIGDNYYDKTEVDALIAEHTFDPTNYYDKSDVDTLLNGKANVSDLPDMTNYYDKSETDALLDDKADVSDLPDMSNYYNKTEVDNKITDLYQIKIVSGSIVHFTDGGNDIPVKSLVSQIVAVESGNGQPKSPTNPYTISGFDSGVITRCGKNLLNNPDITTTIGRYVINNVNVPMVAGYYVLSFEFSGTSNSSSLRIDDENGTAIFTTTKTIINGHNEYLINLPSKCEFVKLFSNAVGTYTNFQIEKGNQFTNFEAYTGNTYTFTFGQTVYGGYFDNKGNLVVTHDIVDLGDLEWSYNSSLTLFLTTISGIKTGLSDISKLITCSSYATTNYAGFNSITNLHIGTGSASGLSTDRIAIMDTNYTDANAFKTALTGQKIVYELTTPITLAITSQDIPTLLGENNISSNTGDVEVEYFTEKSDGIAELIKAFM